MVGCGHGLLARILPNHRQILCDEILDHGLIERFPETVDSCGEYCEFHTIA